MKSCGKVPRIIITYIIVLIGWVFFRADNFSQSIEYIQGMFSFNSLNIGQDLSEEFLVVLFIAIVFSFSGITHIGKQMQNVLYAEKRSRKGRAVMFVTAFVFLILSASYITASGFNPFIYFRF